jgi:hypothetical protein
VSGLSDLLSHIGEGFKAAGEGVGRGVTGWAEQVPGAGKQVGEDIGRAARGTYRKASEESAQAQHWLGVPESGWSYTQGGGGDPATAKKGKDAQAVETADPTVGTGGSRKAMWSPGSTGQEAIAKTLPQTPSLTTDIDHVMASYYNELTNLGPEYQREMDYLRPYLAPTTGQTFSDVVSASRASESPQGDTRVIAAGSALQDALTNQTPPGFGNLASAAKESMHTLPYSATLQAVLEAGKNQVLGYSTIPNISNISTANWPSNVQSILPYLESHIGYNPQSGLPSPTQAAIQAAQQPSAFNPASTQSSGGPGRY